MIVILGALNLTLDFAFIEKAAAVGAPRFMQWYGAFGLMLSLIWIYVSVLRLLALLRARQYIGRQQHNALPGKVETNRDNEMNIGIRQFPAHGRRCWLSSGLEA